MMNKFLSNPTTTDYYDSLEKPKQKKSQSYAKIEIAKNIPFTEKQKSQKQSIDLSMRNEQRRMAEILNEVKAKKDPNFTDYRKEE